jgi:hypothetical protein
MLKFKSTLYTLLFGGCLHEYRKQHEQLRNNINCFDIGHNYIRIVDLSYGVQELRYEAEQLTNIYRGWITHG